MSPRFTVGPPQASYTSPGLAAYSFATVDLDVLGKQNTFWKHGLMYILRRILLLRVDGSVEDVLHASDSGPVIVNERKSGVLPWESTVNDLQEDFLRHMHEGMEIGYWRDLPPSDDLGAPKRRKMYGYVFSVFDENRIRIRFLLVEYLILGLIT